MYVFESKGIKQPLRKKFPKKNGNRTLACTEPRFHPERESSGTFISDGQIVGRRDLIQELNLLLT